MAWTSPMTAVAGTAFTAAQFNTHVRDNLLETAPAKATAAGQYFVATGTNAIAARGPVTSAVNSTDTGTTTSTSYTATLTSGGTNPAVTVTTGTRALVHFSARMYNNTNGPAIFCSVAVSGATTVAASDNWGIEVEHDSTAADAFRVSMTHLFTGLTAGSNTFTMQYKVGGATGSYERREIIVEPY